MTSMADTQPRRAWYRQLWPWLLMVPPALSVAGGVTMIVLATKTPAALVVDDYARIEELTAERYQRDREALRLGLSASVSFPADGTIELALAAGEGFAPPPRLVLELAHAGSATADREILLELRGDRYVAEALYLPDLYRLELMPEEGDWRLASGIVRAVGDIELAPPAGG